MTIEMTKATEAEYLWVVSDRIRFIGGLGEHDLDLLDIELPPGSGTPPHTHESPELFYILDGELTVRQFAPHQPPSVIRAGPGTSLKIPSRVPHNYVNEGSQPVRMLVLLERSMTAFFRDIGLRAAGSS